MSFHGNLKTVTFGDVLQLISTGRRTGALVVQRANRGKKIYFRTGDIVTATSDPPTDEERLGQLLLRRGVIKADDLERALKRQRSTGRKLGQILADLGIVKRDDVTTALRAQAEEAVYSVFGWTDGEFRFIEGEQPDPSQILVDLNTLNVMMEGARRFDEYAQIAHELPGEDAVVRIAPSPKLSQPEIVLTAEDVDVLSVIDGERTVGEILAQSSYGEYAASKALHKLLGAHVVKPQVETNAGPNARVEEEELYNLIYKLYTQSLSAVRRTLSDLLGAAGQRIYFRVANAVTDDPSELVPLLIDGQDEKSVEAFRERVARIPAPVRLHRVMSTAGRMLQEALHLVADRLGSKKASAVADHTLRELAFLLAQKRAIAEKFDVNREFTATLKGAGRWQ